jgi:hypothetical protein
MNDMQTLVEWLDPDWRDHFACLDDAYRHYAKFCPDELMEAVKELDIAI